MTGGRQGLSLLAGVVAAVLCVGAAAAEPAARLTLHADRPGAKIDRNLYGQFAEHLGEGIYGGLWVGEDSPIPNTRGWRNDVVGALKRLQAPVVRWPGGCFADTYHWRDGIGPRAERPQRINSTWGGVVETNAVGSHEFFDLAEQIGAKTYISANVGTGSPQETADWIDYLTAPADTPMGRLRGKNGHPAPFRVDYVGVGNEAWGCGGEMRPQYYADLFRQHAAFVRPAGGRVQKIAVGPSAGDTAWTEAVMAGAGSHVDGLSLHYYTLPTGDWSHKGSGVGFPEAEWMSAMIQTLHMDDFIARHGAIMDKYDPQKRVGLYVDEWGAWYDAEPGTNPAFLRQPNTLRDAVIAAVNLNIFHRHAERVRMANIAQMVNVLQAMVLTDGGRMVLTPTYHVFAMYRVFQDATLLPLDGDVADYRLGPQKTPWVDGSAGRSVDGVTHVALVNLDPGRPAEVAVRLEGLTARTVSGQVLTGTAMDARNRFDAPDAVRPQPFTTARLQGGQLSLTLPPKAVVVLDLK